MLFASSIPDQFALSSLMVFAVDCWPASLTSSSITNHSSNQNGFAVSAFLNGISYDNMHQVMAKAVRDQLMQWNAGHSGPPSA